MRILSQHALVSRNKRKSSRSGHIAAAALLLPFSMAWAQATTSSTDATTQTTQQKVEQLTSAMAQVQAQMEANQKLLVDLQQQFIALRLQMAAEQPSSSAINTSPAKIAVSTPSPAPATVDEITEHQALQDSQIATHELTKVETESKYPLKVTGLLLFNGFINTRQVDIASAPAYAIPGPGSTGLSIRQTVLGFDARGPHVFGASSHADLRVDFFAKGSQTGYSAGVLRLRTAHASLKWPNTEAFIELDRTILEPNAPASLLAIGQPELAWTGNLWSWNPQIGVSHQFNLTDSTHFKMQAALIDADDPRLPGATSTSSSVTLTERSRWPGTEARISLAGGAESIGPQVGIGAYFSPHSTSDAARFDAWAATVDVRLPLTKYFQFTTNAYRGQALGGLGGGGYVDYVYRYVYRKEVTRALEDVGGWTQLQARAGPYVQINAGYGIDNPFAREVKESIAAKGAASYLGLARNRAYYANVIYSPSTYLLFSLEYRRLWSSFGTGPTNLSDVIGIGAGYKF